ncbi:SusC/RagA family TonB-linked outer membrane protein [Pedobacter duraquae]|uniref:TonB-linked SusC/RagA family outer membrane protein n=1 Tax=Pedobacter duraquae TaxID=425511 RepID=A0A4R6IC17_9SPHI|nr:SusC/RagA family TonB-linked outer membrane protein [Pedobacter duraquae]TDO19374.1 TonB-linked SusC/RagA family outer membrane protein [Pedobacter duraquae]
MFKFYTGNRCKPGGYAQKLLLLTVFLTLTMFDPILVKANIFTIDVKGIVYDSSGKRLAGATVSIKGSNKSTQTNEKGEFYLYQVDDKAAIIASFIGFESKEMPVSTMLLTFNLAPVTGQLNEVSVINTGYQNLKNDKVTGSIVQIDNKLLNRSVTTNILDKIQNLVPGVYFQDRDPQLDKISTLPRDRKSGIVIRGLSTLNASKEPLIILDNFPYEGEIRNINPNDIESISILKDAAAASIWGARSGNGVIVITTKKGKLNQSLRVDFNANVTVINKPDLKKNQSFLNAKDYIDVEQILFDKGYFDNQLNDKASFPIVSPAVELMSKIKSASTAQEKTQLQNQLYNLQSLDIRDDYKKYVYQKAVNQQYSLGLRGGTDNVTYSFSVGRDDNKASLVKNGYSRTTVNSLNTFKPLKELELTAGINYVQSKSKLNNNYAYGSFNSLGAPYNFLFPYARFADESGNALPVLQNLRLSYIESTQAKGYLDWNLRPLDEIRFADHSSTINDILLKFGAKYQITSHLNAEVVYQNEKQTIDDQNNRTFDSYYTRDLINRFTAYNQTSGALTYIVPKGSILDLSSSKWNNSNFRGSLSYENTFGKHTFNAIVGTEIKELETTLFNRTSYGYTEQFGLAVNNLDFSTFYPTSPSGNSSIPAPNGSTIGYINRGISYYAIGNYDYNQRFTISLSARKDGANLFGATSNDKFKPFLSAGAGWNINNESFYKIDWLPSLRLRSSYGYQGNTYQNSSAYLTAIYSNDPQTGANYLSVIAAPNPRLQWERVKNINFGIDFSSKRNVISGSFEVYNKQGEQLIQPTTLPAQTGFITYLANTANTKTNGVDLTLQTKNLDRVFKWNTTLLISKVTDKVVKYDVPPNSVSISQGSYIVGRPLNSLFAYKWAGLNPSNGNPRGFLNGKVSEDYSSIINNYNPDSLVFKGSATPTLYGAIRNDFSYGGFTLSVNVVYRLGYVFRRSSTSLNYTGIIQNGQHMDYANRWQKTGDESFTSVPSIVYPSNSNRDAFYQLSEALIESGNHIKLQDVNLSYQFPAMFAKKLKIRDVKIFSYANNLGLLWTQNKAGIDPSSSASGVTSYPNPFSISFGVNANF